MSMKVIKPTAMKPQLKVLRERGAASSLLCTLSDIELVLGINPDIPLVGPTSKRPPLIKKPSNVAYFDTDIGLPIWYDGTQWINAMGDPV